MIKFIAIFSVLLMGCKDPVKTNPVVFNDAGVMDVHVMPDKTPDIICENMYEFDNVSLQTDCEWERVNNKNYDFVGVHRDTKTLVTIKSEPFNSTYDHFVLSKIRTLRNSEVKVDDIDNTTFDGEKFVFVQADKGDIESWHFFGMKDKTGFSISCGGPNNSISKDECQKVFNTVKLK